MAIIHGEMERLWEKMKECIQIGNRNQLCVDEMSNARFLCILTHGQSSNKINIFHDFPYSHFWHWLQQIYTLPTPTS